MAACAAMEKASKELHLVTHLTLSGIRLLPNSAICATEANHIFLKNNLH